MKSLNFTHLKIESKTADNSKKFAGERLERIEVWGKEKKELYGYLRKRGKN